MDALCVSKNESQQLAAELRSSALVSISLFWVSDGASEITINTTRADNCGIHPFDSLRFVAGEEISFTTKEANEMTLPIQSLSHVDLKNLPTGKPKLRPGKRVKARPQEFGDLDCELNNIRLFSFRLNTENMLSVEFVWLGDRSGRSAIYIGSGVSPKPRIPRINFGDEVRFLYRPLPG